MRHLRQFYNILFAYHLKWRRGRPEDIPKKLPPEALAQALAEARFLFGLHGVDVQGLSPGEKPESPRPADGSPMPPMSHD